VIERGGLFEHDLGQIRLGLLQHGIHSAGIAALEFSLGLQDRLGGDQLVAGHVITPSQKGTDL